ncbi:hypothetical protein PRN20_19460 [Devosia sp. ZB163]|uniref:hypothetical protein n=1 Tax=Devosia sp. ZB163 TaxID=3025938 RepID=UPI00235E0E4C|nr:hypothetical protein [Devosia sp. ZB163]MDC9825919.1 hypothetical protein [Devosia sp. ZB163]
MKLDGKVKGGLAWAGLVVILAVPAADILLGKPGDTAATAVTSDAQAGKTQLKVPAAKAPAAATTDPIQTSSVEEGEAVGKFLKAGKKLPSYISDADEVESTKPAAAVTTPATKTPAAVKAPTDVAITPANPPMPLPRSARPKATEVASLPSATGEKPLILDEKKVQQNQAGIERFPLSDENRDVVTSDQLEEWDSGSLADYLERKGLMSNSQASENYDSDGFYLDEGPNEPRRLVRRLPDFVLF